LDRARFDRVVAGNWLDAPVTLTGRGRNAAPAIVISGGDLDLRKLPQQSGAGTGSGGAIPFNARLGPNGPISGRTTAQGGRTAVQIQSSNAGAVISGAGLLKNANEGALTLDLKPRAREGEYDAQLSISNIRLQDPPSALAILSAASGIGLLEQLDGRGLFFTQVSSQFRITPKTVTLFTGSAVGPSIGLSVDGFYDVGSRQIDMQGVVSPFFAINGIGSILTRRGEGLIGFNYTAAGPAASPNINVNPLSIFTPGMFREIFRRPPPKVSQ